MHKLACSNPKAFWAEIKRLRGTQSKSSGISNEKFFEHFKDIYCNVENFNINYVEELMNQLDGTASLNLPITIDTESLDKEITEQEVHTAIL